MAIRLINRIIHQRLNKEPQLQIRQAQIVATLSFLMTFNLLLNAASLNSGVSPKCTGVLLATARF